MEATLARPVDFEALLNFCVSKALDTQKGDFILEGFAATSDLDLQGDIITPTAIKASAKDLEKNSTVLDNHDPNKRIGVVLKSEARPGGLWIQVRISSTVPLIRTQITEGVLNKFSIKGQVLEAEPKYQEGGRRILIIKKMYLTHVAVVSVPANTEARSLRWYVVKALGGETMPEPKPGEGKDTAAGKGPEVGTSETPQPAATGAPEEVKKDGTQTQPAAAETTPPTTAEATPDVTPPAATPPETVKADAPAETVELAREDLVLKAELTTTGYTKVVGLLDKVVANLENKEMVMTLVKQIKAILGKLTGPEAAYPYPASTPAAEPPPAVAKDAGKGTEVVAEPPAAPATAVPAEVEKTLGSIVETVTKLADVVGGMQHFMPGSAMRKSHIDTGPANEVPQPTAPKTSVDLEKSMREAVDELIAPKE